MEDVQEFYTDDIRLIFLRLQNLVLYFTDEEYECYKFLTFEEAEKYFLKTVECIKREQRFN